MRSNQTRKYFSSFVKSLPQLSHKEKEVLIRRLKGKTLTAIGRKLGVTEGRIRQIEGAAVAKAKDKMRQLSLFRRLS
jgi:DNA-directed RNA polymerase sigma subunit (sigma70/sigma32)